MLLLPVTCAAQGKPSTILQNRPGRAAAPPSADVSSRSTRTVRAPVRGQSGCPQGKPGDKRQAAARLAHRLPTAGLTPSDAALRALPVLIEIQKQKAGAGRSAGGLVHSAPLGGPLVPTVSRDRKIATRSDQEGRTGKASVYAGFGGGVAAPALRWGSRTSFAVGLLYNSANLPDNSAEYFRKYAR